MRKKGVGIILIMIIASMALYLGITMVVSEIASLIVLGFGVVTNVFYTLSITSTAICIVFMLVWNLFLNRYFIDKSFTGERSNRDAARAVFLIAAAAVVSMALNSVFNIVSYFYQDNVYTELAESMASGTVFEIFLSTVILAPILEEIIFRGIFYAGFRNVFAFRMNEKKTVIFALIVSSACFGIVHMNISQFVYAFCLGLFLGYVYERTGKLYLSIVTHAICNLISLIRMYLPVYETISTKVSYLAIDAAVLSAVAVVLLLLYRVIRGKSSQNQDQIPEA